MFARMTAAPALALVLHGAVVLDRIAVIVGDSAVKLSDIERDVRGSQFMNRQPAAFLPETRLSAVDRLIDQEIIRQEIENGSYQEPSDNDVNGFIQDLRRSRYGGSETQFRAALQRYGLTEDQLKKYIRWQLTVLRFIDQRFRAGVLVTDGDVHTYYNEHEAELQKAYPGQSLTALEPKIREILSGERVNQNFEAWLNQVRKRTRVEYREAAFQGGEAK